MGRYRLPSGSTGGVPEVPAWQGDAVATRRRTFTRAELESFRGATVPDLIGPGLRLLFVGINPGLWTAATQTHFAHPVNRFYPALLRAGILEHPVDPSAGMTDADRDLLRARGLGITAYRTAFDAKAATPGRQPEPLAGAELWVVPNPSGLNAHETVETLAEAYAAPARAAGVI